MQKTLLEQSVVNGLAKFTAHTSVNSSETSYTPNHDLHSILKVGWEGESDHLSCSGSPLTFQTSLCIFADPKSRIQLRSVTSRTMFHLLSIFWAHQGHKELAVLLGSQGCPPPPALQCAETACFQGGSALLKEPLLSQWLNSASEIFPCPAKPRK